MEACKSHNAAELIPPATIRQAMLEGTALTGTGGTRQAKDQEENHANQPEPNLS